MNEIVVHGPNGVTIRFPEGTDAATIDRVMREATGIAAPPGSAPVDMTRAANPTPAAPFLDPNTGRVSEAARGTPLLDQLPGAPTGGNSPYRVPTDDYSGPPVYQPPPTDGRGSGERAFELGLQGAGAGIADAVGAPVDLANALFNLLYSGANKVFGTDIPLVDRPFGGSQTIRDAATAVAEPLGLETLDQEEMTPAERLNYDISRVGTAGAVGAGGLARGAGAVRPAGGVTPIPRTVDALLQPYAATPGRAFSGDVAAGAGAGAANFAYNEYVPEAVQERFGPVGTAFANIMGGVGGASTLALGETVARRAAGAATNAVRGGYATELPPSRATGTPFRRTDLADAADVAQGQAIGWGQSNEYAPMLAAAEIEGMQNRLGHFAGPDSLPTTGVSSGNPGLIGLEQRQRTQTPSDFVRRDNATRQAAVDTAARIAPEAAAGRQFTNAVGEMDANRVAAARTEVDDIQEQIRQAEIAGREAAAPVDMRSPLTRRAEAALRIDENVVDQTMRPMQEASNRAFGGADPDRTAIIDVSPALAAAEKVRKTLGVLADPSTVLPAGLLRRVEGAGEQAPAGVGASIRDAELSDDDPGVLGDLGIGEAATPTEVSVGDIVAVYPEISRAIDRARQAGNFELADNLQALRDGLNTAIDTAADEGNAAAQRAVAARENYANTLGSTFGRDQPVSQQLRRDFNLNRGGRSETPPSATAGQYLRTGQPERATELQNIIAKSASPEAGQQAVQDYLMADLAATGVLDRSGFLRPDAMRRWIDKWGRALDIASPDTRAMVDELMVQAEAGQAVRGEMASELRAAAARLSDAEKNKGAFAFVLDNNPENAVNAIFSGGDPERTVQQILEQIGTNESALDGFKAAVREYMQNRMTTSAVGATTDGSNPLAFGKLDTLFKRHEDTLSLIFSPEEMEALQASREFLRPLNALRQQALPGSATAERSNRFWELLEVGLKARYGVLKGGGLLRTVRLWAKTLPNNDSAVNQIMTQMMFDPELAKHLLRMPRSAIDTPRYNRRLNQLLGAATGARDAQDDGTGALP